MGARHVYADREWLKTSQHLLDVREAAHAHPRVDRTMDTVQELTGSHHADRAVLSASHRLELGASPFGVDEDRRVDQDGHALLGGPNAARPCSTSRAKSSSGEGASAIA